MVFSCLFCSRVDQPAREEDEEIGEETIEKVAKGRVNFWQLFVEEV